MKTAMNIANHQLRLFGTLEFDEVLQAVYGVCEELWSPPAMGLLIWDADLEVFSDTLFFGPKGASLEPLTEIFAGRLERHMDLSGPAAGVIESTRDQIEKFPGDLAPLYYLRIQEGEALTAIILLAGIGEQQPAELEESLKPYSLFLALNNAWEVRELKRENERLRSRYDDLELTNSNLEEQTRKLIRDVEVKDALRYRRMEKEKVLFEISSAVRSSLEIQQVLEMACQNLGRRPFEVSRALILRVLAGSDLFVYEHHDGQTQPVRDRFFSEAGRQFVEVVLSKTAPCELSERDETLIAGFDPDFLQSFGFMSALLVPIIMREKTIGAIFLQDCKFPRQTWSIDDLTYFGALADQLSVAIENADLHEEKKQQAVTDGLTGIANRRHFNEVFAKEFERARRYAEPLSLAVFDLDYLKKINDTYGHSAGDDAIKAIARVLSNSSRSIDLPARYGGEEFCLLLPNTLLEESVLIAERIRKIINETGIEGPGQISASIGVANFPLHGSDPDDLFNRADEALYAAKQGGRNRVCVYDLPEGNPESVAK